MIESLLCADDRKQTKAHRVEKQYLALVGCHFGIEIERQQAADHRDCKIMDVGDCDWRHRTNQDITHHPANDCHYKRQKQYAEQVKPLLYTKQSAAQGKDESPCPVEHDGQVM